MSKLREELKAKRDGLPGDLRNQASQEICRQLLASPNYQAAELIFAYVNFSSEVQTFDIIKAALAEGKKVAVPLILSGNRMEAALISDLGELKPDSMGIPSVTAESARLVEPEQIDLALIPCLAFDLRGYRLGYGKGYYDRYLPKLRLGCTKLALAFDEQEVDSLPNNIYDYPLDGVLCQSGFKQLMTRVETHCHSHFSFDCDRQLDLLIQEAEQKNYSFLSLTDHYDKDVKDGQVQPGLSRVGEDPAEGEWAIPVARYIDYCQSKKSELQDRGSKLQLLIGLELGYQDYLVEDFNRLTKAYPFDLLVGSVHTMKGYDFADIGEPLYSQGKHQAFKSYLDTLIEMTESGLDFDILAHFDYVTRYSPYPDPHIYYRDHPESFDRLFEAIISRNIALEVNTRTRYRQILSGRDDWGLADLEIYKRYYELGGRLICFATDAHETGNLQMLISDSIQQMKAIGFRQGCYFKGRQAHFYDLL